MRPSDWEAMTYFKPSEFDFPDRMSLELLSMLDRARSAAGVPFVITSSFREGDPLSHGDGEAVDISCERSWERFQIIYGLLTAGCMRIVVYPRHVHADVSARLPSPILSLGDYDEETTHEP